MTNSMPRFAVYHHRFFLGFVSAVSHKQAVKRARGQFPGKRLEVELSVNLAATARDRINANIEYNCKRA